MKVSVAILGISAILWSSCEWTSRSKDQPKNTDMEIYIPVEKSKLYARVVGNPEGSLVINLHGGPGAFSGFDREFNRDFLKDDYLFVYLDQRGGGWKMSQRATRSCTSFRTLPIT